MVAAWPACLWLLVAVFLAGCTAGDDGAGPTPSPNPSVSTGPTLSGPFGLASPAFSDGQPIPSRHSCDAENVSPPLTFSNAPTNSSSLALIMEDPDAPSGTVLHWTFWNLPVNVTQLPEGADVEGLGGREGRGYRGPCPPVGSHRYFFYAYAVDGPLDLPAESGVEQLREALRGRTSAQSQMHGTYFRPQLPPLGSGAG